MRLLEIWFRNAQDQISKAGAMCNLCPLACALRNRLLQYAIWDRFSQTCAGKAKTIFNSGLQEFIRSAQTSENGFQLKFTILAGLRSLHLRSILKNLRELKSILRKLRNWFSSTQMILQPAPSEINSFMFFSACATEIILECQDGISSRKLHAAKSTAHCEINWSF